MDLEKSAYFNDKKRKIDFVLLVESNIDHERENYRIRQEYLKNIKEQGLQIEEDRAQVLDDMIFIKIHAPNSVLDKTVDLYNIDVSCDNPNYRKEKPFRPLGFKCFQNDLMTIEPQDPLFQRAPKTFSNEKPTDYTHPERILLVEKILSNTEFSIKAEDKGYKMLEKKGGIKTAYPIHDSTSQWNWDLYPLTDRQILRRYWASFSCFYQQQPLNLIEKYFGSEVAFYFAWLGFYTTMLIPAAILSVICIFSAVLIYINQEENIVIKEVCKSKQRLCPVCPLYEVCGSEPLKNNCKKFKLSYVLENPATVVYSALMSFWGITFLALWKRKQAHLKLKWNLNDVNTDNSLRPEFIKAAPIWRISSVTGQTEYVTPRWYTIRGYLLTSLGYFTVCVVHVLGIFAVMNIRLNLLYYGKKSKNEEFKEHLRLLEAFVSAFLTILVMIVLETFNSSIAKKMMIWQNPRTKAGYHKSYTTKIVILSLIEVFFPIFYLAYFKGHFYEHPGDYAQWSFLGMIKADVCTISSCLVDLSIQLFVFFFSKNFVRLGMEWLIPTWYVYWNKITVKTSRWPPSNRWEKDYFLNEVKEGYLYNEYITMITQYGFMIFFIAALPIMPIIALINNIVELRVDARKFLRTYRRIVPKKVNGIEEWNTVLYLITILGTISNPLLLAYNTSIIPKIIYLRNNHGSLRGFINSTLSEFDLVDYPKNWHLGSYERKTCLYFGLRYPPGDSQKYQYKAEFWKELAIKTIFFVILENLCLLVSLLLGYLIPPIPRKVEISLLEDQRLLRNTKLQRSPSQLNLLRVNKDGTVAGTTSKLNKSTNIK